MADLLERSILQNNNPYIVSCLLLGPNNQQPTTNNQQQSHIECHKNKLKILEIAY